jgi:NADPH-dependent curcumin reductase CurA
VCALKTGNPGIQLRPLSAWPSPPSSLMARSVNLKATVPEGMPQPTHFDVQDTPPPALGDGVVVELLCLSADPYMRGGLKRGPSPRVMAGYVSGRVLKSAVPGWQPGDLFGASLPFLSVQAISAAQLQKMQIWKLTEYVAPEDISHGIGAMGMPGATAYGGLIDVLRPLQGETIWVSGAGGAVGSMVGQIAKNVYGCTVIGSAGGPQKCQHVCDEFGFDQCIDYKLCSSTKDLIVALREAAPDGIDMYFENVGGMHFEAAMSCLKMGGRVAVCGTISNYNDGTPAPVKLHVSNMIYSGQRVEGFVCSPWLNGTRGSFLKDMSAWIKEEKVKIQETFYDGEENYGAGFQSLFTGGNYGKVVVNTSRAKM